MQISPIDGPKTLAPQTAQVTPQVSAREKAIAALMKGSEQQQSSPVQNPSKVSMEEMSAVRAPEERQIHTNEEPKPQEQAVSPPEEPISSQFAALARKEKALRARAQQQALEIRQQAESIKTQEAQLRAKEAELRAEIEAEYQSKYIPKDKLQQDTLNTLAEAGLTYDQITELMLRQQNTPTDPALLNEIKSLKAELANVKGEQENSKKAYENQRQEAYQESLNQIRMEASQLIRNNPEFETIKTTNSVDDVVTLIERVWQKDKILLTVEEAAQEVENDLAERLYNYATKVNKVKNRFSSQPAAAAPTKPTQEPQKQLKTLTNMVSTTRQLSARERAILAMKGELK